MHWKARLPYWWRHRQSSKALVWIGGQIQEGMALAESAPDAESFNRVKTYVGRLVVLAEDWKRQYELTGTIGNYNR